MAWIGGSIGSWGGAWKHRFPRRDDRCGRIPCALGEQLLSVKHTACVPLGWACAWRQALVPPWTPWAGLGVEGEERELPSCHFTGRPVRCRAGLAPGKGSVPKGLLSLPVHSPSVLPPGKELSLGSAWPVSVCRSAVTEQE